MFWLSDKRIRRIESQMADLKTDTDRMKTDVANLTAVAGQIKTLIAQQNTEIQSLKAQGTVDTSGLEANLADFEAAIAGLQGDIPAAPAPPTGTATSGTTSTGSTSTTP